MSVFMFRCGI